jgi:hypothetical protein
MKKAPTVLVVHPDQHTAEELAAVLQGCGFHALPLANAVDAIENVENLHFDLALVSNQWSSTLPELLFHSHMGIWLEIIVLEIPKELCVADIGDFAEFVRIVAESTFDGRVMSHQMEEVWDTALHGKAGESRMTFFAEWSESEWPKFEGLKGCSRRPSLLKHEANAMEVSMNRKQRACTVAARSAH